MAATFEMAQALRKSHCDKKDQPNHECVGEVTIKRGQVCLACQLCGTGEEIPGWSNPHAKILSQVFESAGICWDALDLNSKRMAVVKFRQLEGGAEYR